MFERQIHSGDYLAMAGGREDIAVKLMQQDREHAIKVENAHASAEKSATQLIESARRCAQPHLQKSLFLKACFDVNYYDIADVTRTYRKQPDEWTLEDLGLPSELESDQVEDYLMGRAVVEALKTTPQMSMNDDFGLGDRSYNA